METILFLNFDIFMDELNNNSFTEHAYFILQREVDTYDEGVIDFSFRMSGQHNHVQYSRDEFLKRHYSDKKVIGLFHEHPCRYIEPSPIDCETIFGMQQGYSGFPKYCVIAEWQLSCDFPIEYEYIKKPSEMFMYPWEFYVYQFNYFKMQYTKINYELVLTYTDNAISQVLFRFLDNISKS